MNKNIRFVIVIICILCITGLLMGALKAPFDDTINVRINFIIGYVFALIGVIAFPKN